MVSMVASQGRMDLLCSDRWTALHRDALLSGCRVLPCALRAVPAVTVMAGHCNDVLTPLRRWTPLYTKPVPSQASLLVGLHS